MEKLTIALFLSILGSTISVLNFFMTRKDKAVDKTKEENEELGDQKLIDYRLTQVEKKLDKILDKFDSYEKTMDEKIEIAFERHIEIYHKKEAKNGY